MFAVSVFSVSLTIFNFGKSLYSLATLGIDLISIFFFVSFANIARNIIHNIMEDAVDEIISPSVKYKDAAMANNSFVDAESIFEIERSLYF